MWPNITHVSIRIYSPSGGIKWTYRIWGKLIWQSEQSRRSRSITKSRWHDIKTQGLDSGMLGTDHGDDHETRGWKSRTNQECVSQYCDWKCLWLFLSSSSNRRNHRQKRRIYDSLLWCNPQRRDAAEHHWEAATKTQWVCRELLKLEMQEVEERGWGEMTGRGRKSMRLKVN